MTGSDDNPTEAIKRERPEGTEEGTEEPRAKQAKVKQEEGGEPKAVESEPKDENGKTSAHGEVKSPSIVAPVQPDSAPETNPASYYSNTAEASEPSMPAGLPPSMPAGPPILSVVNDIIEERGELSSLFTGKVIGKGGEMIRDLQARSACRIDVDQDVPPGYPRVISYRGTRKTIDFAKQLVNILCQEGTSGDDLPLGEAKRDVVAVPQASVGKIIGRGGEMIKEMQNKSKARIQVDHGTKDVVEKQVTIIGTDLAITKAREMVLFLVANPMVDSMELISMLYAEKMNNGSEWGSGPPYMNLPNQGQNMQSNASEGYSYNYDQSDYYGSGLSGGQQGPGGYSSAAPPAYAQSYASAPPAYQQAPYQRVGGAGGDSLDKEMFYAARHFMGRLIGKKGVTINDVQRRSGTDIQINQDVPGGQDCEIEITGPRHGIEMAKQIMREIIEVGPNHQYEGGGGYGYQQQSGGYGYGGQGGQGGHQGQSYQHTQATNPYQQQASYGGASQASEWKSATSPDGKVYYYNERTGETQWDRPMGML